MQYLAKTIFFCYPVQYISKTMQIPPVWCQLYFSVVVGLYLQTLTQTLRMDIMGQICEIRCCIEILLNNNKMYTIIALQSKGIHTGGTSSFKCRVG